MTQTPTGVTISSLAPITGDELVGNETIFVELADGTLRKINLIELLLGSKRKFLTVCASADGAKYLDYEKRVVEPRYIQGTVDPQIHFLEPVFIPANHKVVIRDLAYHSYGIAANNFRWKLSFLNVDIGNSYTTPASGGKLLKLNFQLASMNTGGYKYLMLEIVNTTGVSDAFRSGKISVDLEILPVGQALI